jgi:hypothetical protein
MFLIPGASPLFGSSIMIERPIVIHRLRSCNIAQTDVPLAPECGVCVVLDNSLQPYGWVPPEMMDLRSEAETPSALYLVACLILNTQSITLN